MSQRRRSMSGSPTRSRKERLESLRATPRSAASALRRRRSVGPSENIQMNLFDISGTSRPLPPTDPMEDQYQEVSIGETGYTKSLQDDVEVLANIGFEIDIVNGLIGSGFFGKVYRGVYGPEAPTNKDSKGQRLRNVAPGQPFAVKAVDFNEDEKDMTSAHFIGQTAEKRESYEIEKQIMTFVDHPNVTSIRMAINMGECRTFTYEKSTVQYVQHDRVYLIMDLAECPLMDYVKQFIAPSEQMKLTRDCFKGLKYLHDNEIAHGDIHVGNVLIFRQDGDILAKWADFGLSFVSGKGAYSFNTRAGERKMRQMFGRRIKTDCERFANMVFQIWWGRKKDDEPADVQQLSDRFMDTISALRTANNLDEVYNEFSDILLYEEKLI